MTERIAAWTRFFNALDRKSVEVKTPIGDALHVEMWPEEQEKMCYWVPVLNDLPLDKKKTIILHANQMAVQYKSFVYVVLGCVPPMFVKTADGFHMGGPRQGAICLPLAPPHKLENGVQDYAKIRFSALQETQAGELDVLPMYCEDTPFKDVSYEQNCTSLSIATEIVPAIYIGRGRSTNGPRLSKAYAAMKLVEDGQHQTNMKAIND